VLGDSLVMAVQVPLRDTLTAQLERLLNADAVPPATFRVINAGVQGYGPVEEYLFYRDVAAALQPDIVILALYAGNDAVEAVYPMTTTDGDGQVLDGSQHAYTLTFPAGQLPPVNAFWSVTMYDGKTQLLVRNPIGRYLINSTMLPSMKKSPDGSLTIYIQKESPGKATASNWLPAPNGPIYLVMRLYWPKTEPPSILPPGDGTWQPPAIRRADAS